MNQKQDSFEWIDVLLKRWQIIACLVGGIFWLTTLQAQLNAQTTEQLRTSAQLDDLSGIGAEWPYLKEKVDKIDKKVDFIITKL